MSTAASPSRSETPRKLVVMGVSGCGKSSVGKALAEALGGSFVDGDDLHPPANIAKMSSGIPLTDEDRWPWLEKVGETLGTTQGVAVVGCSALKRRYRDLIRQKAGQAVTFVHLSGSREVIEARMKARPGHFMPASLLDSQFAALEPPGSDEAHVTISIEPPSSQVIAAALAALAAQDLQETKA